MDRILQNLSDYALGLSYDDLPQEVIDRAKHIVVDTVGCALGAAQSPPAVIARLAASEVTSTVPATVLVSGQKTSPDLAAFANGVMIRYLDFNDTYTSGYDDRLGLRQALLRAAFQALGEQDPLPWSAIAANGEVVIRSLPNAALVYALEDASVSRHIGETVLLSLVVLGEPGLDEAHTMALSVVLSALSRVGLQAEARALAIEAALASGV